MMSAAAAGNAVSAVASVENAAKAIERQVVSPCCFSQTVDQHRSGAAAEVRSQIRAWLAEGLAEQEILDRFVVEHGEKILAVPKAEGFNTAVWWMPIVAVLTGALGLRSYLSRTAPEQASAPVKLEKADRDRLSVYLEAE